MEEMKYNINFSAKSVGINQLGRIMDNWENTIETDLKIISYKV